MRFIEVDKNEILKAKKTHSEYHNYLAELTEFMHMNVAAARVVIGKSEYKNTKSAEESLRNAIRYHKCPIRVVTVDDQIYFIRTDM